MNLSLHRFDKTSSRTIGDLTVNDVPQCLSLEDTVREVKIPHETAIPVGKYRVIISYSNRFRKPLPELLDVPNFSGVRIHSGNTAKDTEGCILVGYKNPSDPNSIIDSRIAFNKLYLKLKIAFDKHEDIWITIS